MPVLENRYHLDTIVYSDNTVIAYQARDQLLNRAVTVELLRPEHATNQVVVQRMLDKARAAALGNLPHVAALYDQNTIDQRPFLVLEEMAGPALADRAPLPPDQAIKLVETIAETLEAGVAQGLLPNINGQTIRMHPEGRIQLIDLGLTQMPPDGAAAAQALGLLLSAALAGATDKAAPLQAIADRANAGQYGSTTDLLAELRQLRRHADSPTTVIPRTHPTIPIPDAVAAPTAPPRRGTTSAQSAIEPAFQRRHVWAIAGAVGVALLLLLGSMALRGEGETAQGPTPSAVASESPAASAGASAAPVPQGETYVVNTRGRRTLVVRTGPGRSFAQIASLAFGTQVQVIEGPQPADGYNWVHIRAGNVDGWCISEALRKQ